MSANTSANQRRASRESAEDITAAELVVEAYNKLEAEREADPMWTALITYRDDKTLKKRWRKIDEINSSIGL